MWRVDLEETTDYRFKQIHIQVLILLLWLIYSLDPHLRVVGSLCVSHHCTHTLIAHPMGDKMPNQKQLMGGKFYLGLQSPTEVS